MQILERLQQQFSRIDPRDRRALLIVATFLGVVFAYVGLLEPVLIRSDQAHAALADLTDQHRRYSRQARMLPRREAKLVEYRSELAALKRYFELEASEPEAAVAASIVELTYYARLADVQVGSIRPLDALTAAEYLELPFELEASANFDALRKFFYYIDTSPSLLAITDLQLTDRSEGQVQARLKLSNIGLALDEGGTSAANLLPQDRRLQLAISRWTGYAPLVIAKANGYLESESLQVNLLVIEDEVTVQRLLVSGEVDGAGVSLPELLTYWIDGIPLRIVLPIDSAAGTEGIAVLSDSDIRSTGDLRQRRIGVMPGGILNFVLLRALQGAGLNLSDVEPFELNASQVARELASGTMEVGMTREPYLSALVERGQARSIYTSDELKGLIVGTLAMTPNAIDKKAQVVQFLVEALLKAREFIATQPKRAAEIVAEWENQSPAVTEANLEKITFYDNAQIRSYFELDNLSAQLSTFEAYFESIDHPLPLVTARDIALPTFFEQAVAPDRSEPAVAVETTPSPAAEATDTFAPEVQRDGR